MGNEQIANNKIGLSAIIFIIYSLYYISGYSGPMHNYIIVALFLVWNFIAAIEDIRAYNYAVGSKVFLWLFLFLLYYFFSSFIIADLVYTLEYVIIYFCLYGTAIQYRYYYFRNSQKEIRTIIYMLIMGFVIFSLSAISFYTINPSAARILAADYYAFDNIAIGGGYSIAFGASILSVFLFEMILRRQYFGKKNVWIFIILFVLFEILLIKTESTTTLIANIFGILIGIIAKMYDNEKDRIENKILISAILIVCVLLVVLNINEIGKYIVDITANGTDNVLIRRFNRIGQKMQYQGVGSGYTNYVDERFGTISKSWNTFLQNPVFGVGYKCGNIYSLLDVFGVGAHSEFVDVLAQYGIVGFSFWIMFISSAIKYQNNSFKCKGWKATLLIMLIFNPFRSFHGYVVAFFLIPIIGYMIEGEFNASKEVEP
ncbi:MAG: O-antigen ligase family protein [Acutalibacter sp.]